MVATEHGCADVGRVVVIGAGLIGAGWTTVFLAAGLHVTVSDPAPGAEDGLARDVARRWPAVRRLGLTDADHPPAPVFAADLEGAVAEADWVQESVPDDESLKAEVMRRVDAVARPDVIIASSTSGIPPTRLQGGCGVHPGRVIVGHPFNPVHILPLVEVVGGRSTSADVIHRAIAFYEAVGKRPLHVRAEIPGFIANRLQEALNREVFHLVAEGVATCEEIDAATCDGPGLRYAIQGPSCVYMLQGGAGGAARALRQFSPARIADWSYNHYPEMTAELIAAFDAQTREMSRGRSLEEWEQERDEFLIRALQVRAALRQETRHAGAGPGDDGQGGLAG